MSFPAGTQVRPTPDRVRETLFNWLAPHVEGASCLDLFAGTGALGLEALSRGAKRVVFVEQEKILVHQLHRHLGLLNCQTAVVRQQSAFQYLACTEDKFDLIFLDPPFFRGMAIPILDKLLSAGVLTEKCLVYLEVEQQFDLTQLTSCWCPLRQQQAGQVVYCLLQADLSDSIV